MFICKMPKRHSTFIIRYRPNELLRISEFRAMHLLVGGNEEIMRKIIEIFLIIVVINGSKFVGIIGERNDFAVYFFIKRLQRHQFVVVINKSVFLAHT